MSSCQLSQNIPLDCRASTGGIKSIFVTSLSNQSSLPTISGATGVVTAYTLTPGSGAKFFRYDFRKATGEWTETGTLSDPNWTSFWAGDVKIQFTKLEANKRSELQLLGMNDLVIIVLDNNGNYWLTSTTNGATLTTSAAKSGKAFGDLNGYTLEFKYEEPNPAYLLPAALMTALLLPA